MGKFEYLGQLAEAGLPVPPFVEVTHVVVTDAPFIKAMLGDGPYAVRSSCDYEDSLDTANAGRYTSVVGVSFDGLPDAIRQVEASYKNADGKIIVQAAISPVLSGIAFSSSPEGFPKEVVMSFGAGFGEKIVTDSVDVVTYHVSYDETCVWQSGDYAAIAKSVDASDLNMHDLIDEVAGFVRRCADVIGSEADMEFAVDAKGKVWVLQARPITRIAGMSQVDALNGMELLDSSNIVESYPGVVLPLTQSFAVEMYRRIFTAAVNRLTGTDEVSYAMAGQLEKMLVFSDWHAYYRIASWYAVLSLIPFSGMIKRAWRASLGVEHVQGDKGTGLEISSSVRRGVAKRFFHYLRVTPKETAETCDYVRGVLDRAWADVSEIDDAHELLRICNDVQDEVLSCWDITLFNDIYTFLWTFLAGNKARRSMTANEELASMHPVKAMHELVGCARTYGLGSSEYLELRDKFVSTYGDRAPGELKLETRTWRSRPESLDEHVASALEGESQGRQGASQRLDVRRDEGLGTRRGGEPGEPFDGVEKSRPGNLVRPSFAAKRALRGAALRERSRLMRTEMFGMMRICYDRIGETLVQCGALLDSQDIYYLTMPEVEEAVRSGRDMQCEVSRRKQLREALSKAPAPKTLYVCGSMPWNHSAGSLGSQVAGSTWDDGDMAMGTGTSPGKVVAEAVVADGTEVVATHGKVIVALSTDPGWAYMLDGAAAIVAERGSLLSHTAIISREMGIPAVVGVKGATDAISSGDTVEVDGDTGTVRIVRRRDE